MSFYLKKYMWLIVLLAIVLCSFFLAKIASNFIAVQFEGQASLPVVSSGKGTSSLSKDKIDESVYQPIIERNIFDSRDLAPVSVEDKKADKKEDDEVDPTGEAVASSLNIKLVSTFSVGNGEDKRSSCVFSSGKSRKKSGSVHSVGDEIEGQAKTKIVRVLFNRVEFVNKGRLEYLELDDFTKGHKKKKGRKASSSPRKREAKGTQRIEKTSENSYVIDRAEVDAALENLDKLYTQVRLVPYFKDGRPSGLKFLSVRSGSIFAKLGLKRGDILKSINGMELDMKRALEIFNQLKNETNLTIELERRGQIQKQDYEIR